MDPVCLAASQPLPGDTQLLWRHHRWVQLQPVRWGPDVCKDIAVRFIQPSTLSLLSLPLKCVPSRHGWSKQLWNAGYLNLFFPLQGHASSCPVPWMSRVLRCGLQTCGTTPSFPTCSRRSVRVCRQEHATHVGTSVNIYTSSGTFLTGSVVS